MLAFLATGDLEKLVELENAALAAAPTFGSFVENRLTWVVSAFSFSAVSTRCSIVFVSYSTTLAFANGAG